MVKGGDGQQFETNVVKLRNNARNGLKQNNGVNNRSQKTTTVSMPWINNEDMWSDIFKGAEGEEVNKIFSRLTEQDKAILLQGKRDQGTKNGKSNSELLEVARGFKSRYNLNNETKKKNKMAQNAMWEGKMQELRVEMEKKGKTEVEIEEAIKKVRKYINTLIANSLKPKNIEARINKYIYGNVEKTVKRLSRMELATAQTKIKDLTEKLTADEEKLSIVTDAVKCYNTKGFRLPCRPWVLIYRGVKGYEDTPEDLERYQRYLIAQIAKSKKEIEENQKAIDMASSTNSANSRSRSRSLNSPMTVVNHSLSNVPIKMRSRSAGGKRRKTRRR